MSTPHVLVIPAPAQGHVNPALEFSQCLARHGFRITFVISENNEKRVLKLLEGKDCIGGKIQVVWISDGRKPGDDIKDWGKSIEKILQVAPGKLQELIQDFRRKGEEIDYVIADLLMGWAIEVAEKMRIRAALFNTASAASMVVAVAVVKRIDDGTFNKNDSPLNKQKDHWVPNLLPLNTTNYFWDIVKDLMSHRSFIQQGLNMITALEVAEYVICNSTYGLESTAFNLIPKLLPAGPLLTRNKLGNSTGHFGAEDSTCLKWLDQQQPDSVIYVAFGSLAVFDKIQFQELALGLELCNRPFLWVVRQDFTNDSHDAYPDGFMDRAANRGRMVSWAPQQMVLNHPSIGCFLSHCGWNSTMEGVCNGVPFLCWPCFSDQILNESYICDVWKVGLKFNRNERGVVTKEEINSKINQVLSDKQFKARASELKEKTLNSVRESGASNNAILNFIESVKTCTEKCNIN